MKSKVIVILSAFIFAVAFGVVGWFGVASLAAQLQGWVKAQAWQQVPATVVEAELIKTQDEGTTYRATARYRYQVNGKTYESTRVGFFTAYRIKPLADVQVMGSMMYAVAGRNTGQSLTYSFGIFKNFGFTKEAAQSCRPSEHTMKIEPIPTIPSVPNKN